MVEYDVLIIGAGPIGLACGIEAVKSGKSYVILDKGCLVNSIYHYPLNMTFFSTSEKLEIGNVPFVSHGPKPVRSEALEYYRRVAAQWKLNLLLHEPLVNIVHQGDFFFISTINTEIKVKSIILSTGFFDRPNLTGIKGELLPKVLHYYKEPHPFIAKKVAVIGAANSAVDVALECYRKGAEVTMVIKSAEISDRVKYWVKPDIDNRIKEGSIRAYFESEVVEIKEKSVLVKTREGMIELENDFVLAMTGYLPDFTLLEQLGINISSDESRTPTYAPDTMETNVRNVYLAGVICGGMNTHKWFIENSRVHAELIFKELVHK